MQWNEDDPHLSHERRTRGLRKRSVGKRVMGLDLAILQELEEPRGGRPWMAWHGRIVLNLKHNYSTFVLFVKWVLLRGLFAVG